LMRTWPGKRPKWRWCCRLEPGTCDPALWARCGGCSWGPGGEKRQQGSTELWGALSCGAFFSKKYCLDLGKFFVFRGMFNGQVSRGLVNQWKINQFSMLWTAISYPIIWRWIGKKNIYIYGLIFTGYAPGYGRLFKVVCLFNLVYGFTGSWRYIGSPS
jgi:hypothetical protein